MGSLIMKVSKSMVQIELLQPLYVLTVSVCLTIPLTGQTRAQWAYFSVQGDFNTAGDEHDFHFDLTRDISSEEDLRFQTYTFSGGTNAAGKSIAATNSFDSSLELFDSADVPHGQNDTIDGFPSDALLSWEGVQPVWGTSLNPDPLPAGSYRLNLQEYADGTGPWAVDLVGPLFEVVLTGATPGGDSTINSLDFGTETFGVAIPGGAGAYYIQNGGTLTLNNDLSVATTGAAELRIEAGGVVSNAFGTIGKGTDSYGDATVTGAGSRWNNADDLTVGAGADSYARLNVEAGGAVSSARGVIGLDSTSTGDASVTGNGSQWNNAGELRVGSAGFGFLHIATGGVVSNTNGIIALAANSGGSATVTGAGSQWNNSAELTVGSEGGGTLQVMDGGVVSSANAFIGRLAGASGVATVTGSGSQWNNSDFLMVGSRAEGTLNVEAGGVVSDVAALIGLHADATGVANVTGPNSQWNHLDYLAVGYQGSGTLVVSAGGAVTNTYSLIGANEGSDGSARVSDTGSTWTHSGNLHLGDSGTGTLRVEAGGAVTNVHGFVGFEDSASGSAVVTGTGSTWTSTGNLNVGRAGAGTLNIEAGGIVTDVHGFIGYQSGATGAVTVTGAGSQWTNSGNVDVGEFGNGTLTIEDGGVVQNVHGFIGYESGSSGAVTVQGLGSIWTNTWNLRVGGGNDDTGGEGTLVVSDQGRVEVGGVLTIWSTSRVTLDGGTIVANSFDNTHGGTFDFIAGSLTVNSGIEIGTGFSPTLSLNSNRALITPATTTIAPFHTLSLDGGTLETGDLVIDGALQFNSGRLGITGAGGLTVGSAGPFGASLSVVSGQNLEVTNSLTVDAGATFSLASGGNISADTLTNSGIVLGSGALATTLANQTGGIVRVQTGDLLAFSDTAHTNDGDLQLQGGRFDFEGTLTNHATGNILGRGTLSTTAGFTNTGDVAISNGQSDVFGDVSNESTGRVIISGSADVTFWDDVTHTGAMFNVSTGSSATFFGEAGFGISGGGDIFFEADVTPGSSPGFETFGGNVHFGVLSHLEIELGGAVQGSEYDAINVAGFVDLDGTLDVRLIELLPGSGDFTPTMGETFTILTATGGVNGTFATELLPVLNDQMAFSLSYMPNSVLLEVVSTGLPGDYNNDGIVDLADYTVWRNHLGATGIGLAADGDGSGTIDLADYQVWRNNFGNSSTAQNISKAAVPEPSAFALLTLFTLAITGRYRMVRAKCDIFSYPC